MLLVAQYCLLSRAGLPGPVWGRCVEDKVGIRSNACHGEGLVFGLGFSLFGICCVISVDNTFILLRNIYLWYKFLSTTSI